MADRDPGDDNAHPDRAGMMPPRAGTRHQRRRFAWALVAIFFLAAVPRLLVVESGIIFFAPDTLTYVTPARNLIAGRGYTDEKGKPYSFRPPTYPLFLAAVFALAGDSIRAVQVAQAFLSAAGIAALAYWLARRHGPRTGMAAGIALAVDPILIPVPAFVLTEALGTLLVTGTVVALQEGLATRRTRYLLLAGALGGAAALNTPITLLLLPWLLVTAWLLRSPRRPEWRACALTLLMVAACIGVWTARNAMVRGEAIVVRDNGFGALVWAMTVYDFDWLPSPHEPAWADLKARYDALHAGLTDSEAHTMFLREAWGNFRNHPFLVTKRVAKANFWFWIEAPGSHVTGDLRPVRWLTLGFHQLQLFALVLAVCALWRAKRLKEWTLWVSTMAYFAVFLSLMMPIPRYYVPLLPVVNTLIAVGLTSLVSRWARTPPAGAAGLPPPSRP
jgi:4-amino-4-deoxy-L-arabinose transferase-like glycosyltransferase